MRSAKEAHMGRPKVSDPRNIKLKLHFTATEYECLVRRAKAVGARPVHFSRMLVLDKDVMPTPYGRTSSHVERLNYLALNRVGSNLNQMMRHLHRTGEPAPADLGPLLTDIRPIIERGVKKWL
jgi:hypothetical protein